MKIVSQVNTNEHSSRGGVDTHIVSCVIKVLGTCISLNVMGIIVSPSQLYIHPVLLSCGAIHNVTVRERCWKGLLHKQTVVPPWWKSEILKFGVNKRVRVKLPMKED